MGYAGNLLQVDLTKRSVRVERLNMDWARMFIGGKGLAAKYLYELLKPGTDSFSSENILILMTGPVTGTVASTMSRVAVVTKSALTGTFLDSYAGGYFPAELKFAGFDGIIVRGRSEKPVFLLVKDGVAELREATELWGKSSHETTDQILGEIGERPKSPLDRAKIAAIGPAGEKLVRFANIVFDYHHFAGRGGAGAVMGSKKLKAIAVRGTLGSRALPLNSEKAFLDLVKETIKKDIRENPREEWAIKEGTPFILQFANETGILPTRNFQTGTFPHADQISFEAMKRTILVRHTTTCFSCAIGCRNQTEVKDGRFAGVRGEGPEYETLAMMGSNLGISDIRTVSKLNQLCSQLGMDTISTGNILGWLAELYERSIVSNAELDGIEVRFGDEDSFLQLTEMIARRKGIGNLLAEGLKRAAEQIGRGSQRYALHVKGQEYPAYDPRGSIGMALAYATADRGACHMRSWPVAYEAFGRLNPFTPEGKAELVVNDQIRTSIRWSLVDCDFYSVDYPVMARLLSHVLQRTVTEEDLRRTGRRIWTLVRMFNLREGFSRADDTVPPRITNDPLPDGAPKERVVSTEDFDLMLDAYYSLLGWDQDGRPRPETLAELHLK